MLWHIFYEDGPGVGHEDGSPADAPTHGVISIVQWLDGEGNPQVIHQCDYYWWRDQMWWGGDLAGFLDQSALGATWLKQGRTIRTHRYRDVMGQAVALSDEWLKEATA